MPNRLKGQDWRTVARANQPEGDVFVSAASEPGRGRAANRPSEIPFRGWQDILWRLIKSASEDRILATPGSVAFFALLAAFPAVATVVSLYGIFADEDLAGPSWPLGQRAALFSSVIGTASTARHLRAGSEGWAFATDRQRRDPHAERLCRTIRRLDSPRVH
jgi:hypothetical protein